MSTTKQYKYNDVLSKEQNILCSRLCSMRLSQMSQALAAEFTEPNEGLLTFEERITKVINREWEYRDSRKFNKFLKKAGLKYPAADLDRCADLFELIEAREMRGSTIFLSQLPFENWYDLFADKTYADAIIRRMVAHSYRLEMNGRDMTQPS